MNIIDPYTTTIAGSMITENGRIIVGTKSHTWMKENVSTGEISIPSTYV